MEIARVFREIADLLEIKGDNPFKIRAYRQGARTLELLPDKVGDLIRDDRLYTVKGIGPALEKKIKEMLETGHCGFHDRLREEIPPGLLSLRFIPGLGPRNIRLIHERLNINSLEELAEAARNQRLRGLPGIGAKTESNLLKGLEELNQSAGKFPLGMAVGLSESLLPLLEAIQGVEWAGVAGETRRCRELIGELILVAGSHCPGSVIDAATGLPQFCRLERVQNTCLRGIGPLGMRLTLVAVPFERLGPALVFLTGSEDHYQELLALCSQEEQERLFGLEVDLPPDMPGGISPPKFPPGAKPGRLDEADVYRRLNLDFIPPELREGRGEIVAAGQWRLPKLIGVPDILGDLHIHSNWSDGVSGLESLACAAEALGYQYLAVTDHSRSLAIAGGLTVERLLMQQRVLQDINAGKAGVRFLSGVEADILPDGSLDYPDEVLAQMDVVIASIHSGFKQDQEKIMQRLEKALLNPHVDILGHPTGRLLGRRPPYPVDAGRLLQLAVETGTILEINATGNRLDLSSDLARRAGELGVRIAVNTDAHSAERLQDMRFGVAIARRAWLSPDQVVNTLPFDRLLAYINDR